ncbi:MAG: RHS repeat protein, partial [Spirochaetales bacterium]|nr:RHS repeat protein [Spirochaetales bacterium]
MVLQAENGINIVSHRRDQKLLPHTSVVQITFFIHEGSKDKPYDELNRLTSLTDADDETISFLLDPLGRIEQRLYPNDEGIDYTYDPSGRV